MNGETRLPELVPGLYEIGASAPGNGSAGTTWAYFLTSQDVSPAVRPTLEDIWNDPTLSGWFVFLTGQIVDGEQFVAQGRRHFPSLSGAQTLLLGVVWAADATNATPLAHFEFYQVIAQPDIRTITDSAQFTWAPLTLSLDPDVRISFDPEQAVLSVTAVASDTGAIQLSNTGQPQLYDGTWSLRLALVGRGAGAFQVSLGLDLSPMMAALVCGQQFAWAAQGEAKTLSFPLFAPVPPSCYPGFDVQLHPLFPTQPEWTAFAFDFGGATPNRWQATARALRSSTFSLTNGGAVVLAPVSDGSPASPVGFSFSTSAQGALHLAPLGVWEVVALDDAAGSPVEPDTASAWRCGLSGLEYLELREGDRLAFEPGQPAFAPMADGGPRLTSRATTSWVRFPLEGARRYFGQAGASVYFAAAPPGSFTRPVTSRLAELSAPTVFPLVPYGAVFSGALNQARTADDFARFESLVLTAERHARATVGSAGPLFSSGASAPRHAFAAPEVPVTAVTPQGFVVQLNDDGSWKRVELAVSPDVGGQQLCFEGVGSPAVVPAGLASLLLQDELFLVVSDATQLGGFANELSLAGFHFTLDVGGAGPVGPHSTILVFKFNTRSSLVDLVERPELWAGKERFVTDLAGTRTQLRLALTEADGDGSPSEHDPFVAFRQLASAPEWTGVLAFNCAINGNGMPLDLQMILGGINGQLRAHHFGIQRNQLSVSSEGAATIATSSLFGVIAYPSLTEPAPPVDVTDAFDYEIEKLNVVLENSRITLFNVIAGLTVNQLFGRAVELDGGPVPASPHNTLQIPGRYQVVDGVGTVTFSTSQPFVYRFPVPHDESRVVEKVVFERASLVPLSADAFGSPHGASPAGTQLLSRFSLGGSLWFEAQPFAEAPGLDLFSYGVEGADGGAMNFEQLAVDIRFTLDAQGAMTPGSKQVTGDLSRLTPSASRAAIRTGSLLASLPLQLSKFLSSPAGFTASALGASPVHVLQLEGADRRPTLSPVPSPLVRAVAPPPNVTTVPQFALEFDLPLGSLGALSDVHVGLMAKLFVAWGPSRVVPDTDAAAVLVQLPQAFAGYGGFNLQGILKTTFGDANLLRVELEAGPVYAVLFNNIKLSVLGYGFPPGLVIDFLIFAGDQAGASNESNLAWFLGAQQPAKKSPEGAR